jgi:hypothetical protein
MSAVIRQSRPTVVVLPFSDLLVAPRRQSLTLADLFADRTPTRAPAAVNVRRPKGPTVPPVFQVSLRHAAPKLGPDHETWFLWCCCDVDAELRNMILCEKCLNWQHQI